MDLRAIAQRDAGRLIPLSEDHRDIRELLDALGEAILALNDARETMRHIAGDATYREAALDTLLEDVHPATRSTARR